MLILAFCSVIISSCLLMAMLYNSFAAQIKSELKSKAYFLEQGLSMENNQADYLKLLNLSGTELRITLVAPDGAVLYDNTAAGGTLENHANREEIIKARENGSWEIRRVSETLGRETYYYADILDSGSVLRVSKTASSIFGMFVGVLPESVLIIAVILLGCLFIARRLTKKLVDPINSFDFESDSGTYDELAPFIRTITLQKRQIQSAAEETNRKNDIITAISRSMKEGLILAGADGAVLLINDSALSILNISADATGKNIMELTRIVPFLEHMRQAVTGERTELILPMGEKQYNVFFSSVDRGVLILFLDVTETAKAEKMRREFSANVSHELKTPLTAISGYAELMANDMVTPGDVTGVAKKIKSESERLLGLIEDIIRLSELDESDGSRTYEKFNLTEVIQEITESLKAKSDEAALTLETPETPDYITANRRMIYEMLYNLVENAIKYNNPNGKVLVSVCKENGNTQISVKDTGIGIEKAHHDRIFERFYRVDKSRSKKIGGTGLGLSIVKHIAAYHGGAVRIESEPSRGTEITVSLPDSDEE